MLSKAPRETHRYRFLVAIDGKAVRYSTQSKESLSVLIALFAIVHGVFLDKIAVATTNYFYFGCI